MNLTVAGNDGRLTVSSSYPSFLSDSQWAAVVRSLRLSPQQSRVVGCLLCGMRDKQIAASLNLSIPTVRTHLARVFARLGVEDRVGLVLHIFANFCRAGPGGSVGKQWE